MARRPSRRSHHGFSGDDINLTPMMNVFMVIIPFLLMTTVFARTVIIDIYLPGGESSLSENKKTDAAPQEVLTIQMTRGGFAFSGLGKGIPPVEMKNGAYDFALLTERLAELKAKHPDREEEILLFEPDTPYDLVVKTMDATRETAQDGKAARKTLFPLVSVGENTMKN